MTLLNYILAGPRRAVILQDGASYFPDGRIAQTMRKCEASPTFRGAIATTGPAMLATSAFDILPKRFEDIDDLAENGEDFADRFCNRAEEVLSQVRDEPLSFKIWVVGWSEQEQRIRSVTFGQSIGRHFDHDVPFFVDPLPDGPAGDAELRGYFRSIKDAGGPEAFDPIRHGLPFIEKQRRILFSRRSDHPGHHAVGAYVEATEITPAGVRQRIIHRWPEDTIGETISVRQQDQPAVPPAALSRRERRALAANKRRFA